VSENCKQIYRLVNKEWISTRPVTENYHVAILLHTEGNVPFFSNTTWCTQSSCHTQGHDTRDTLYPTITPLNPLAYYFL